MSKHLMRDLEALERMLLELSSRVEQMVQQASRALVHRDPAAIAPVLESENWVDVQEVVIEEECLKILALHQPVASDLRRVTTLLKINNELERIADLAVNICERTRPLDEWPDLPVPAALPRMFDRSVQLVRDALDAFVRADVAAARRVMSADEEIDAMNREVIAELQEVMQERHDLVAAALHCFSASRHVERIADHATNIAEDIIYLVDGEIARHQHEPEHGLNAAS
ncbi:MAG: phosphate signaling complex protein PhoU [Planctomycetales bacterium]|nr:phosphate signaling complex protein PhoU [Planctomycetales bacterium]